MSELSDPDFGVHARRLRVETLVRLRWLAIAGQLASLLVVQLALGFPLPIIWCLAAVAASVALNVFVSFTCDPNRQLDDAPAALMLSFDILQLAVLLFLTGGIENPFALLILAPAVISAVSLPRLTTGLLFVLTAGLMAGLALHHEPLPWSGGHAPLLPPLYRAGLWLALTVGAAFVCVYAGRVAEEARALSDALAATELILAREQHLSQLDGLAAAAAHELGTPLATITLIAKEMARRPNEPPQADDIALLTGQAGRCREILGKLRSLDDDSRFFESMKLGLLLEEICAPMRQFGAEVVARLEGDGPPPVAVRSPGVLYGLGNLVENAVDFARSRVEVLGRWDAARVEVVIADDGPGFAPEVRKRFGVPYLRARGEARKAKNEDGSGLGLGLFIAKTLLERSGAVVSIENAAEPASGARVRVSWPREVFERARVEAS
jgi:two-component system sensor histidine kinase RegB